MKPLQAFIGVGFATIVGLGVAAIAGWGDTRVSGWSILVVCALVAYLINWLVFVPSALLRSEKFFDLTGSLTYLSIIVIACLLARPLDLRASIVAGMVMIWAVRLGSFLYLRIRADGVDRRFDKIKRNAPQLLMTWTLQGCWVTLTAACALLVITTANRVPLDWFFVVGLACWIVGFGIEVIADNQKRAFKRDPANTGSFIRTGLWAWSRHPNYFGEILLWTGIAIITLPVLNGPEWIVLVSPVFVALLLLRISGVPLLERQASKKWGDDPDYQTYRKTTPLIVPRRPKRNSLSS